MPPLLHAPEQGSNPVMPKVTLTAVTSPLSLSQGAHSKPLLLCFSHLRWDFVYQRPQHLLSRAARSYRVVFFEEPVLEDTREPRLVLSEREGGIVLAVPHLPRGLDEAATLAAQRGLVDDLIAANGEPALLWYYSPMAMAFSSHIVAKACVYDCMDELANFKNAPKLLTAMERRLMNRADVVFTGGMSLYEAKRGRHANVHGFPSSIDVNHFGRGRSAERVEPADQKIVPGPRLGFFGVIDERMDIDLVRETAQLRPDWQFVMIGPVVKIDPDSLPRLPNIHWLGGKPYSALPDYIGGWDVGFMPFARNDATKFISPTKTPEFLAAGVPVVSTPIRDVVNPYGEKQLVEIAATAEEVVAKAELLLAGRADGWLERVDRHLSLGSWDRTWNSMNQLIRTAIAAKVRNERRVPAGGSAAAASAAVMGDASHV
jgi:glycosyltransferase involved in cell wall biosynthesis